MPVTGQKSAETKLTPLCVQNARSGAFWLAQLPGIAGEIRLTKDQLQQLSALRDELRAERRRLYGRIFGGTGAEHDRLVAERRKKEAAITIEMNRRVVALLDDKQRKRLDQLYVQFLGPRFFLDTGIADRLGITLSQQKELAAAVRAKQGKLSELLEILNPSQRAEFRDMRGTSFAFPQPVKIRIQQP
jgi:hypothetical protein